MIGHIQRSHLRRPEYVLSQGRHFLMFLASKGRNAYFVIINRIFNDYLAKLTKKQRFKMSF
jgi:hypothetical protein